MLANFRLAFRSLLRSPGFTLLAVITLGLGIGANTAMFSIVNSILLKPLPHPQSDQLQRLDRVTPQNPQGRVAAADYLDLRGEMQSYGEIGAYALGDTSLSEPGQPAEMVRALRVTANLLPVLRVQPQLGRNFLPREDVPGNDHVVILSQRCWQQRFGSAHDIIGRSVRVDGQPHEVVGVLPAWFNDWRHFGPYDFFRPLALDQQKSSDRRTAFLRLLGRRHDGMSESDAAGFIANFGARLARDFPEVNAGTSWNAIALNGTAMPKNARALLALLIG
jgi:putative ABC transport system permease protein